MGALGTVQPESAQAGIFGTVSNIGIGGTDNQRGPYVIYMFNGGGSGGFDGGDGLNYGSPVISVVRSQPAELYDNATRFRYDDSPCETSPVVPANTEAGWVRK
jgi:N-methylhydantoinase B